MPIRAWVAEQHEAETAAALLIAFRDHNGSDWPSDNAFYAGVERLLEDPNTEFLLASVDDDSPPAGVIQLRFRFGIWKAATDAWLESLDARSTSARHEDVLAAIDAARDELGT